MTPRTPEAVRADLARAADDQARWQKETAARDALLRERHARERALLEAEAALSRERRDVDRLSSVSLASLLAALKGDRADRLEREQAEALAACLRRDQAQADLADIDRRLLAAESALQRLGFPAGRVTALEAELAEAIAAAGGPAAAQLASLEAELAGVQARQKELEEAEAAGRAALQALDQMADALSEAGGLGQWDLLGGGMLVSLAKRDALDRARSAADRVQAALRSFRAELADVAPAARAPEAPADDFTAFADWFFDNLFTDLAVQRRIRDSESGVSRARAAVEQALGRLASLRDAQTQRLAALRSRRTALLHDF